jgi:Ras-related GTP-binding protein A/B
VGLRRARESVGISRGLRCSVPAGYFDDFLANRQDSMFRQVHSMIYIFDVESPAFSSTDGDYFSRCLVALKNASSKQPPTQEQSAPYVHVLIHKMDLVNADTRAQVLESKSSEIRRRCQEAGWGAVNIFGTSIWNETLYRAWSTIVSTFIPNSVSLKNQLVSFAEVCGADEVVLFETTTFLVISRSTDDLQERSLAWKEDRFETICQCIKMFRLSCSWVVEMLCDRS